MGKAFYQEQASNSPIQARLLSTLGVVGEIAMPLWSELLQETKNSEGKFLVDLDSTPFRRALKNLFVWIPVGLGAFFADGAGDTAALVLAFQGHPTEGVILKGAINTGSHALFDVARSGVNNFKNIIGSSVPPALI